MWTTPFNPFIWDQTSKRVTSHVAGLEVRDEKGDIINMTDPSRKITVILPLDKKATHNILKGFKVYRKMMINHNITVQYGQSFVNVSFKPQSSDLVISKVKVTSATNQNYADCENVGNNWIKIGRINCDANVAVSNVKESKRKKTTQSPRPDRSNASCVTIKKTTCSVWSKKYQCPSEWVSLPFLGYRNICLENYRMQGKGIRIS